MSILEILEAHGAADWNEQGRRECTCGHQFTLGYSQATHRAHVAQVLEQHEREAKAAAWESCSDAWEYAHSLDNHEPWEHVPPNPYRSQS